MQPRKQVVVATFATIVLVLTANAADQSVPSEMPKQLAFEGMTVNFHDAWNVVDQRYGNAQELIRLPRAQFNTEAITTVPRVMILTQKKSTKAKAIQRLKEIDAEQLPESVFLEIGGWPALQRRYIVPMERRGENRGDPPGAEMSIRVTTAVAFDTTIVRMDGVLPPGALARYAQEIISIGRSLKFPRQGDPAEVQAALKQLREAPRRMPAQLLEEIKNLNAVEVPGAGGGEGGIAGGVFVGPVRQVQTNGAGSEIEVAVSTDAQHVVVVSNGRNFSTSNDCGLTFPIQGTAPPPPGPTAGANGDPSIAFGESGNFYFAYIGFPSAPSCSTGITSSADNGQSFQFITNATTCNNNTNSCFPDQEHIAADRWNAGANGDQVYSTWRDFSGGGCGGATPIAGPEIPSIVCSNDSGQTWTGKIAIDASGCNYPRITVGQDGFVYVVYRCGSNIMLNKFSSCDNGLDEQDDFPVVVSPVLDVPCPVPGLDRCNNGNNLSSHTVAVDDTDPSHIYIAFASSTDNNREDVFVIDSTNGGEDWGDPIIVNGDVVGRRFMPWVCSTGGEAYVSWYDTRTGGPIDNTDFYCGSASPNADGDLVAGPEFELSPFPDPLCDSGWRCAPRAQNDSESCPTQPQLAGFCTDMMGNTPGNIRCDYSDCGGAGNNGGAPCQCPAGMTCNLGNGCPRYGDYNGNACMAGNMYNAWASAINNVTGAPDPNGVTAYYSMKTVNNEPPQAECMPFEDFADENCCIVVDVADIDNGSFDPNGCADIDTLCITDVDGSDAGCVQSTMVCDDGTFPTHAVTLTITDFSGESNSCVADVTINDIIPPEATCDMSQDVYEVDENCEVTVTYTAQVTDNCCVNAADTTVTAQITPNATLVFNEAVDCVKTQTTIKQVDITCTAVVSDLTSCPAEVTFTTDVTDCKGNDIVVPCEESAEITDVIPPAPECPDAITLDRGDKLCNDDVQDWLDSFTATDNCSSLPSIQETTPFLALPIPDNDNSGISHTISIADVEIVDYVAVDLWVTHDYVGDLEITLTHNGITRALINRPDGGSCDSDNYNGATVAENGLTKLNEVCVDNATSPPVYGPFDSFAGFNGQSTAGDWTLTVKDLDTQGTGRLDVWGLRLNGRLILNNDAPVCGFPFDSTTTVTFYATDGCNNTASCDADITILPPERVDASRKGSILIYPDIELQWRPAFGGGYDLVTDTYLSVINDYNQDVNVHFLFVNGDDDLDAELVGNPPTEVERAHAGWTFFNWTTAVTANESTYLSMATGDPAGGPAFTGLDNVGGKPGRPDTETMNGSRVLRGYAIAWAVDNLGRELTWNFLSGKATIVNFADLDAWEYEPYAYVTECLATGEQPLDCTLFDANGTCCTAEPIAGNLDMDAFQYAINFNTLLLDFFASGSTPFVHDGLSGMVDTDLSILPVIQDLRQNNDGPVHTKLDFDIWDENEEEYSGTERCIWCWDQFLLSNTSLISNNFLASVLDTDKGKARIDGVQSSSCEDSFCCDREDHQCQSDYAQNNPGLEAPICSRPAPLLGVAAKVIGFSGAQTGKSHAGSGLPGQGRDITGNIKADLPTGPEQAEGGE